MITICAGGSQTASQLEAEGPVAPFTKNKSTHPILSPLMYFRAMNTWIRRYLLYRCTHLNILSSRFWLYRTISNLLCDLDHWLHILRLYCLLFVWIQIAFKYQVKGTKYIITAKPLLNPKTSKKCCVWIDLCRNQKYLPEYPYNREHCLHKIYIARSIALSLLKRA